MPKYTKRIQSYQIQGSHLNEFEFQQDQGALAHNPESVFPNEEAQTNPDPAARIAEVTAAAHRKVEKRRRLGLAPPAVAKKAVRKGPTKKVAKKAAKKVARKLAKKATKKAATKAAGTSAKKVTERAVRKTTTKTARKSGKKPAKRTARK